MSSVSRSNTPIRFVYLQLHDDQRKAMQGIEYIRQ